MVLLYFSELEFLKDLALVEKDAENKDLSAKLHQYKMDSTYQRDVLQILIQDKENIDIDESLLSPRKGYFERNDFECHLHLNHDIKLCTIR